MLNVADFKTKTMILDKKMPKLLGNNQFAGKTINGLDIGYSGVKGVASNRAFIFPSYVKKLPAGVQLFGSPSQETIRFRDNTTGDVWAVGSYAEKLIDSKTVSETTDMSLYTRYRYDSDTYKVLTGTGLALGLLGTPGGNDIHIQTGLPSDYLVQDTPAVKKAMAGHYDVSIALGADDWKNFKFTIPENNVHVMEQPKGTMVSLLFDKAGNISPEGAKIGASNVLIYDCGFNTEDIFNYISNTILQSNTNTATDTSMRAVFEGLIDVIEAKTDIRYKVFQLQNFLETGHVKYRNRLENRHDIYDFINDLERINRELCEKSITRLIDSHDDLVGYEYLIVTGGTGESRFDMIQDMLKGFDIKVIRSNERDTSLPLTLSNARGYYMNLYSAFSNGITG